MAKYSRIFIISIITYFISYNTTAQVNSVEFGKNRVQYKKFKWQYYQTKNFNVYFNENGQEIAKYVAQAAEKELPDIEKKAEYSLQRRANIVVYNQFADMQQSNIGLGMDWQNTGGVTKLVNNKMVVYFEADHQKLLKQVKEGVARILTENILFGESLGEFAGNQALLDLPKWLIDGYIAYLGENWSPDLDDELKSEILSSKYKKFYQFAFDKPLIAGHAFWYYIEERYKKENVTYFLYLARTYKNLNKASSQICKKKFKALLQEFMEWNEDKYYKDIKRRKAYPRGSYIEGFNISKRLNYYRFNVNPNKRNNSYVVTQYKKGIVRVIYNENFSNKTLLKYGIRSYQNEVNPNYPLLAWDPKGAKIAVMYNIEGRLNFFVYDVLTKVKTVKFDLTNNFDQVQDIKYMPDNKNLLLSAVKNGHTDIYTLNLQTEKINQVTNDVYDDLDPSFVAFPNKTGIIFSSNRPSPSTKTSDTILPSNNRYNIFLITNFEDKAELNQITQLSQLKYGNARFPTQYNENHFTFVSDENGVGNRYAGFFTTKKEGLDTLVLIGDVILRNPDEKEIDSTLSVLKKTDVDSVAVVSISSDSAYTFPLTNYQSKLDESRIAGENNQVSEVTRQMNEKILYKIKIDENTLRRRNVTAPPTEYMKKLIQQNISYENVQPATADPSNKNDIFQNEFSNEKTDSSSLIGKVFNAIDAENDANVLSTAKLYNYKPPKFYAEFGSLGFNNSVLINRYQPWGGPTQPGPIMLNSSTPLNGLIRLGTSELMEDLKITGGFRLSTNLRDNEWFANFQNLRKRVDWGLSYYRSVQQTFVDSANMDARLFTNIYQANIAYPFDKSKSVRLTTGIRSDNTAFLALGNQSLKHENEKTLYSISHLEFVYDNTLNPTLNIWNGLRYKIFLDWNRQVSKIKFSDGPNTFNAGFDARYYYPIYRNFIWAGRAAGDFSWGNQKIIYYLGGADGWLMLGNNQKLDDDNKLIKERYFNTNTTVANDQHYAFQSLAVNLRGFLQNTANGNNALVINSEFRLPVFSTFVDRPINNAFLRNFQLVQFIDLGTAWNGKYDGIKRPTVSFKNDQDNVTVKIKAGGVGPFAGGYGFGARSMLLGYFVKFDAAWTMNGIFRGNPIYYVALGLDF